MGDIILSCRRTRRPRRHNSYKQHTIPNKHQCQNSYMPRRHNSYKQHTTPNKHQRQNSYNPCYRTRMPRRHNSYKQHTTPSKHQRQNSYNRDGLTAPANYRPSPCNSAHCTTSAQAYATQSQHTGHPRRPDHLPTAPHEVPPRQCGHPRLAWPGRVWNSYYTDPRPP